VRPQRVSLVRIGEVIDRALVGGEADAGIASDLIARTNLIAINL